MSMEYNFRLEDFEGPLDLLLHLIKKDNIDIFDINISEITNQYLNYINHLESLNLNIDSEYLVMASELTLLKSRELLPHSDEEDEEDDPREELINRLIEYQKYKDVCGELKKFENDRKNYFTKSPSLLNEFHESGAIIDDDISLDDLIKAFMKFQEKKEFEKPLNTVVTRKEYSVHKRSKEIMSKLKKYKQVIFDDLFDIYKKDYVVVTFLSILDLAKNGNISLRQDSNLDSIILSIRGENEYE